MKYCLFLFLFSCSIIDIAFGPYTKEKYCSGISLQELDTARKRQEMPKKSSYESVVNYFYQNEDALNECFKRYTVKKIKKRYYCVVLTLEKTLQSNKLLYIAVDNIQDGADPNLVQCLEDNIKNITKESLGLYDRFSLHYQLVLKQ